MRFSEENQQKVLNAIDKPSQKNKSPRRINRIVAVSTMGILLFSIILFLPSMEHVIAKIPFISHFVKEEEQRMEEKVSIFKEIQFVLDERGMEIGAAGVEGKEITVHLMGLTEESEDIADQIQVRLEQEGFANYDVNVTPYEEGETEFDRNFDDHDVQNSIALQEALTNRLQQEGYELMFPVQARINDLEGIYMNVIVPDTENRLEQLEEIMKEVAKVYGDEYKLDIRQVEKIAREQEIRWEKIGALDHISSALMEGGKYPVTGFAHSFHPYPLQIKIKTSMKSDDSKALETAKEILNEIDLYIKTDERTKTIREDLYEVKVLSKDKREIKVK
jgi:translation elongation factor EF-1beta